MRLLNEGIENSIVTDILNIYAWYASRLLLDLPTLCRRVFDKPVRIVEIIGNYN